MTTNKNLAQPAYNSSTWNIPLNANFGNIDLAFGGVQNIDVTSVTGTINLINTYVGNYPANSASYIPLAWNITGNPSGIVNIVIPSGVSGRWVVMNSAKWNPYLVEVSSGGTSTIVLDPGINDFYCNGSSLFTFGNVVGDIKISAANLSPAGWLLCYGQSVATASYPYLYSVIGTLYGGSGSNFNVPDLRGRVVAGLDNMGGSAAGRLTGYTTLGSSGGEQTHLLTTGEVGSHTHSITQTVHGHYITVANHAHSITDPTHTHTDAGHTHGYTYPGPPGAPYGGIGASYLPTGGTTAAGFAAIQPSSTGIVSTNNFQPAASASNELANVTVNATATATGHNNVQPTMGMNFLIKF